MIDSKLKIPTYKKCIKVIFAFVLLLCFAVTEVVEAKRAKVAQPHNPHVSSKRANCRIIERGCL